MERIKNPKLLIVKLIALLVLLVFWSDLAFHYPAIHNLSPSIRGIIFSMIPGAVVINTQFVTRMKEIYRLLGMLALPCIAWFALILFGHDGSALWVMYAVNAAISLGYLIYLYRRFAAGAEPG